MLFTAVDLAANVPVFLRMIEYYDGKSQVSE